MITNGEDYLASNEYIDWQHPLVTAKALELAKGCLSDAAVAERCFEFVRDSIKHSWDYRMHPVTCKASEILIYGTGYCYAKSHLIFRCIYRHSLNNPILKSCMS